MLKRAVGWLKDKTCGRGGKTRAKRSRDVNEEQEIDVWADEHLIYACPFARVEQPQPQPSPSSLLSSASDAEAYVDVDLTSDAGGKSDRHEQTGESSQPPPSYHSFAAATGLRLEAPSSLLMRGPSERVLSLLKRARHTQTQSEGAGMLYLGGAQIINQAQKTNSTSNNRSSGSHAALPDVYLNFFDVFDFPIVPLQEHGQEGDDGDQETVVDDGEEGEEEEELRALADNDKAALSKDDDDDHSSCSSPLFPPVAAKSEEDHHVQSTAYGVASLRRPFNSASSSPDTIIYTFTSEMDLRALVAPEAFGVCGGVGQWKEQREAVNVKNEDEDEDDTLALFDRRPAKTERIGVESAQAPSVIWERVEALVDCKVELSEEGCSVSAGSLQCGVPLLFGIETETFWAMEEIVCVNLYKAINQLGERSLLLLAKHASQRPPWAPERLELVVLPLDTKGNEQNAAAMLSLLAPAHVRGPAKGGDFDTKLQVFEGRGELGRRLESADFFALLDGHDGVWKVGCSRSGGQYKRKQE